MEKKITAYYSRFEEIYHKENFPKWFKFINEHNKQFGSLGYKCNCKFCPGSRVNNKPEHELGHYAILQTPLCEDIKIVIVGNNNSWFDEKCAEKALKEVKPLRFKIPERNFYTVGNSKFSKSLIKAFRSLEAYELLQTHTVGINRTWLQTGGSSINISKMKEKMVNGLSIVEICHIWTEEIISIMNPKLVLLLGEKAQRLFSGKAADAHGHGNFFVQHCRHPSHGGQVQFEKDLKIGIENMKKFSKKYG
tara:strand:- start:286 stop:1032 length:747 start_codon:yes stop_codon:yes gene_type:complete